MPRRYRRNNQRQNSSYIPDLNSIVIILFCVGCVGYLYHQHLLQLIYAALDTVVQMLKRYIDEKLDALEDRRVQTKDQPEYFNESRYAGMINSSNFPYKFEALSQQWNCDKIELVDRNAVNSIDCHNPPGKPNYFNYTLQETVLIETHLNNYYFRFYRIKSELANRELSPLLAKTDFTRPLNFSYYVEGLFKQEAADEIIRWSAEFYLSIDSSQTQTLPITNLVSYLTKPKELDNLLEEFKRAHVLSVCNIQYLNEDQLIPLDELERVLSNNYNVSRLIRRHKS